MNTNPHPVKDFPLDVKRSNEHYLDTPDSACMSFKTILVSIININHRTRLVLKTDSNEQNNCFK